MNRSAAIVIALITLLLAAVPLLDAQPQRMAGAQARPGIARPEAVAPLARILRLGPELALTEEQKAQIAAIARATREKNAAVHDQLREGAGAAFAVLLENPGDLAGAQAALDRQEALRRSLHANHLAAASGALSVLTAEQRQRLAQIITERKGRMEQRRRW